MAGLSIEEWFATHGLPYDKGADSVGMLKLIEEDTWVSLFATSKLLIQRKALIVFKKLNEEDFDSTTSATSVPLRQDGGAAAKPASTKRKHSDLRSERQTIAPGIFDNKRKYTAAGKEWTKSDPPRDVTDGKVKNRYKGSNPEAMKTYNAYVASSIETPGTMDCGSDSDDDSSEDQPKETNKNSTLAYHEPV